MVVLGLIAFLIASISLCIACTITSILPCIYCIFGMTARQSQLNWFKCKSRWKEDIKALGLQYPRDHALQADANDTLLGDDANRRTRRCSQTASSPQPPACFRIHASSWTSLLRLLCRPLRTRSSESTFAPWVMRNCREFTTGRTGASWVLSDRLYEIAKGLRETKRREHEDVEKARARRWPIEGI